MTIADLGTDGAGAIIRARLGRTPQDALEAAVVLEAWGGVPADAALSLGSRVHLPASLQGAPRRWKPSDAETPQGVIAEGIALLIAILAIAAWAGPLGRALGDDVFRQALQVGLPVTLALQWAIRSRYLSRRAGLACLAEDWVWLVVGSAAIAAGLATIPDFGYLAAMFVAVWVGGTILTRRGWGIAYGVLLIVEAVLLENGVAAVASLAALTGVIVVGAIVAIVTAPGGRSLTPPGRLGRAVAAGVIGGLLGVLLVGDPSLGWGIHGTFPALALVPSVAGSFWGGYRLWQFHEEIPRGMRGVELSRASATTMRGPATGIVVAALVRLIGLTVALSCVVALAGHWTRGTVTVSLFVAFGCAALVCLFVSLLESLGYVQWALFCAAASVAVELAISHLAGDYVAGAGLIAGGVVGTTLALAPLVGLLRSPGRVLATTLWIH